MRNHEGRGIGLSEKLKAYRLQDDGLDTVDANLALGHQVDSREWSDAIEIIKGLGLSEVTVMTNNPEKISALVDAGIATTVKNIDIQVNEFNQKYLETKTTKLGHQRLGR